MRKIARRFGTASHRTQITLQQLKDRVRMMQNGPTVTSGARAKWQFVVDQISTTAHVLASLIMHKRWQQRKVHKYD